MYTTPLLGAEDSFTLIVIEFTCKVDISLPQTLGRFDKTSEPAYTSIAILFDPNQLKFIVWALPESYI